MLKRVIRMTTPKPKSQAKASQLRRADLNFISNYPLEQIASELQQHEDKQTGIEVVPFDDDTMLFRMERYNKGKLTASVNGRMKRWAGDMTHIYCDGRSFARRDWARILLVYGTMTILVAPIVLHTLATLFGYPDILGFLFLWSLLILIFGLLFGGPALLAWMLIRSFMKADTNMFFQPAKSQPEAKDRERLLHILTSVIADGNLPQATHHLGEKDLAPLSDEELQQLVTKAKLIPRSS